MPWPLGSLSLSARTTHQRATRGSTAVPSAHRSAGRASASNQARDAGGLRFSPRSASASRARGATSSAARSSQAASAPSSAARGLGEVSLARAPRRATTAVGSASSASHCAAASRCFAPPVRARAARSPTRGESAPAPSGPPGPPTAPARAWRATIRRARGRLTVEGPMAICTRVGRICSGTVGMCSRACSAWAARRVSRRRSTTRSGLASAHGQTLCGSWWYHNQLSNQVAQSRSGRSVARRTCSTARGSRRLTEGSYSSPAKSGLRERASIRARCSRCRREQSLTIARTSWSWRLEGISPSAPSAMAMSRSMSESVTCSSRRRSR